MPEISTRTEWNVRTVAVLSCKHWKDHSKKSNVWKFIAHPKTVFLPRMSHAPHAKVMNSDYVPKGFSLKCFLGCYHLFYFFLQESELPTLRPGLVWKDTPTVQEYGTTEYVSSPLLSHEDSQQIKFEPLSKKWQDIRIKSDDQSVTS